MRSHLGPHDLINPTRRQALMPASTATAGLADDLPSPKPTSPYLLPDPLPPGLALAPPPEVSPEIQELLNLCLPAPLAFICALHDISRTPQLPALSVPALSIPPVGSAAPAPALGLDGWPSDEPLQKAVEWISSDPAGVRETWWPMASWGLPGFGNPNHNLWASGGPCSKFDQFTGRQSQEYQSKNLRRTITHMWDAIKNHLGFEGIERIDGLNAGHCDQVAGCSAEFAEPKLNVVRKTHPTHNAGASIFFNQDSVTLTPRDIKGLMALCLNDLVKQKDKHDDFGFTYEGYRYFKPPQDVAPESCTDLNHPMYRGWNDPNDPYPHRVIDTVIKQWMAKENKKIVAERKPGEDLDNYCYDACKLTHIRHPPNGIDVEVIPRGGTVRYYEIAFIRQASPDEGRSLHCWVHESIDGEISSNWIRTPQPFFLPSFLRSSTTNIPNFYWTANLQTEINRGAPWIGFAESTNPEIDMLEVWRLYKDSTIGENKRVEIEERWPDRIEEHGQLVKRKMLQNGDVAPKSRA